MHLDERGRHGLAHDLHHLAPLSLGLRSHRRADARRVAKDAPRVDERLHAGEDEEDLEHEASFAVVPVDDDDDDEYLEGHAEQHRREQRGGEAGVAGAVVDRDAEDVGAHVGEANDGRHAELDLI